MAQQMDQATLQKLQQQEEQRQQQEEMVESVLKAILSDEARSRLNNIKLVKPEKAQQIIASLLQGAKMGRITNKISEAEFLKLVESSSTQAQETKVSFKRRTLDDEDW
ncbi:hypothetical protein ABPG74_018406 [Tetrahymena malaccensis]